MNSITKVANTATSGANLSEHRISKKLPLLMNSSRKTTKINKQTKKVTPLTQGKQS